MGLLHSYNSNGISLFFNIDWLRYLYTFLFSNRLVMNKCSYTSLAPYLFDGVFVIVHHTGEMYMHLDGNFIRRVDGLSYNYNEIPPIYLITHRNYHFIAMGVNRWDINWCFTHFRYKYTPTTDKPM